jgi:hypothetical protein
VTAWIGAVLIVGVTVLSGCSGDSGGVSADPDPDPVGAHPVVLAGQGQAILNKVSSGVASSVAAGSAAGIGPRLVGPQREILTASFKLPARLRSAGPVTNSGWRRLLVPARSGWPRWYVGVGVTASRQTPVIWVLTSESARAPYGLWGELDMLPGARLPEVAPVDYGAPELSPGVTGLVAGPRDVASRYADLLGAGSGSRDVKAFAPDVFREQVVHKVTGDRAKLLAVRGTVTSRHVVRADPLALRTTDGGALVIAALTETYTIRLPVAAGSVNVEDPVVAALAGRSTFTSQVVQTSTELVAFSVPPAAARGQVQVVAAAKARLSVTGD